MAPKKKSSKKKKVKLEAGEKKLDNLHYMFIVIIAFLLIYIFSSFIPEKNVPVEIATTSTTTVGQIIPEDQKDLICNPCFDYFKYAAYIDGALSLENGDKRVEITGVSGARFIGRTVFDPGETLGLTGIPTDRKSEVQIKYKFDQSEVIHTDVATING